MNLPVQFQLNQESLQELAEQLKPYLFNDEVEQKEGDFLINGEFYPPTINMNRLAVMWNAHITTTRKLVKAFLLFGISIGVKSDRDWMIDTKVAIDCMKPEKMMKAKQKIKEGKV